MESELYTMHSSALLTSGTAFFLSLSFFTEETFIFITLLSFTVKVLPPTPAQTPIQGMHSDQRNSYIFFKIDLKAWI